MNKKEFLFTNSLDKLSNAFKDLSVELEGVKSIAYEITDTDSNAEEQWADVVGYEGLYQVSDFGRVRSIDREDANGTYVKGRILKQSKAGNGYRDVCLSKKNNRQNKRVHRLVARAFLGEDGGCVVDHKNGIRSDNRLSNLEYVSHSINAKRSRRCEVRRVRDLDTNALYDSTAHAALELFGDRQCRKGVWNVCAGRLLTYKGKRFEFVEEGDMDENC